MRTDRFCLKMTMLNLSEGVFWVYPLLFAFQHLRHNFIHLDDWKGTHEETLQQIIHWIELISEKPLHTQCIIVALCSLQNVHFISICSRTSLRTTKYSMWINQSNNAWGCIFIAPTWFSKYLRVFLFSNYMILFQTLSYSLISAESFSFLLSGLLETNLY